MRLLLVSTSRTYGTGYLDHCEAEIRHLLGERARVCFVPYALHDRDAYAALAQERFARMGYRLESVHRAADPAEAVAEAEAIFVGGGNTFRLLEALYRFVLLEPMRERVRGGVPYIGSSAGTNVACPTIQTTNDMPIVQPPSFEALGLVPFQVNPHYLDPDPASRHMGETREQRILEYLEEKDCRVVGLREGAMLRIEGGAVTLVGQAGARVFGRGSPPQEYSPPARLDFLLEP